ncbi:hypothetical protein EGT74_09485 [Chitinophaga lutea]|uniref:Endonuclease/exonuclease/phosphatase domain-containing protein n=1 Tax=Chitinophaga lutea TaxID=2488634 RepID=A0A3N4QQ26_9BACT|nr:endonuclease/exonuclease/phosphatase family protein [Chitinophaga lutea]RPE13724.1 hypothetical protein EGT74_09485 [Chitinophaga lutea]
MKLIRVIIRRLLLWSNVSLAIALLLSFFLTFIDPASFSPAGFAGLPFIFLWLICLFIIPIWLFYRRKYWLISIPALLLTLPGLITSWGFHFTSSSSKPSPGSFTVMTFNCSSMGLNGYLIDTLEQVRIYEELEKASPDILCLQEFFTHAEADFINHINNIRKKLNYGHYYFIRQFTIMETWHYGSVLFSRFPIIDTANVPLPNAGPFEVLMRARLLIGKDTVRLLSGHLASYKLRQQDYAVLTSPKGLVRKVANKMRRSFGPRSQQAQILRDEITASTDPLIVVGDLNDVPVSFTYKTVRGNLQDAFLAKGAGLGRTFSALAPNLRIDYIFADRHFNVDNFFIYRRKGFEHFPVMTRLSSGK